MDDISLACLSTTVGLPNVAQIFQRFMDNVCHGLDFINIYLYDLLVKNDCRRTWVSSAATSNAWPSLVWSSTLKNGSIACLNFTSLVTTSISFVQPLPDCIQAIRDFLTPFYASTFLEYLRFNNYYHCFIPNHTNIRHHLYELVEGKLMTFNWKDKCTTAYQQSK